MQERILIVLALLALPLFGYSAEGLCVKDKEFSYTPYLIEEDNKPKEFCYVTKEEFLLKSSRPDFILSDLRSVRVQELNKVISSSSYSIPSLKLLLNQRDLNVLLLTDKSSLVSALNLCTDSSLRSRPSIIPYGVRGIQSYGLKMLSEPEVISMYSIESYINYHSIQLKDMHFVVPSNFKDKKIHGSSTIVMDSIDLDLLHAKMDKEVFGRSVIVIPRLLFKGYKPDKKLLQLYPEIYFLDENIVSFVESLKQDFDSKKIIQKGC